MPILQIRQDKINESLWYWVSNVGVRGQIVNKAATIPGSKKAINLWEMFTSEHKIIDIK